MVVLLVLLVSFLDLPTTGDEGQVLEFFAGVGRIAALAKYCGYKSSALDIRYGEERYHKAGKRSPMDINSNSGLVWLVRVFLFSGSTTYHLKDWLASNLVSCVLWTISGYAYT